ncbi:hypothetical protein [Devosia sp. 1635]|uniref:hypothetical protein n=1 Tax=Devosia sp. 1635 TaxID=2726066 RepID=UPI001563D5B6|nr:hypothetical protein [Devosia sp. 1635]
MATNFGLHRPVHLLGKLRYDLYRLKEAKVSSEARYAALDCANDAWHLVDWVLASVSPERHKELCGHRTLSREAAAGFRDRYSEELPKLKTCQQIANTGKHLILSRQTVDQNISTFSSARFDPAFDATAPTWTGDLWPVLHVEDGNGTSEASSFFGSAWEDWHAWLSCHEPTLLYEADYDGRLLPDV